jgi:hypothetical protein
MTLADPVDAALDGFHRTDVEYATSTSDGLSNHGPMVVASLAEIGRFDRIEPFVQLYAERLRPLPALDAEKPRLGDPTTRRAWIEQYEQRLLGAADWRSVARAEVCELLPGAVAAAAHGWLRTAHAVDMLVARDNETRRRELAFAFASWAARFRRLPGVPGARATRGLDVASALARVPIVPASRRSTASRILDQIDVVAELDRFADVVDSVDLDALPIEAAISSLASASARAFLASPVDGRFAYLHTITATSALRLVAPILDATTARSALGAVFQTVAALHATNADASPCSTSSARMSRDEILAAALETLGDHDVKLAVATVREDTRRPQPEILAAAAAWLS